MTRKSREVPPEMRTMGVQSVYRLFDSFGCFSGQHIGMVLCHQMITVTTSAKKQMASICETSGYAVVRYSLNGGGCSGLIGKWEPETHYEPSEGDMTWSLGEDKVFVSRIRKDNTLKNGISLWIVADNLRKGAALNAIQIGEELIKKKILKK